MAIGTLTMILTNVGLSIFNNWAGSRQNKMIADKREEFERAVRDGQRERMLQLMREGQELTLQMEEENHQERLRELNNQFDNLIKEMTYSAVIDQWPLKTLPIVMKNQALGNLLANQEEKVALHCILTPCNCDDFVSESKECKSCYDFNNYILPKIESDLEVFCNLHWSNLSGRPVLFYSGAWKGNNAPTETQISSLQIALNNLPTILITPYFRPTDGALVFQVYTWGVGINSQDQFSIPTIEPTEFQREYTNQLNWLEENHLIEDAIEDVVPYLQCLIGYIADTYFWSAFGSVPQLPNMIINGTINTDGMKYLLGDTRKYYEVLLQQGQKKSIEQPFVDLNLLNLYEGVSVLCNEKDQNSKLEDIFYTYCEKKKNKDQDRREITPNSLMSYDDLPFLSKLLNYKKRLGLIDLYSLVQDLKKNEPLKYNREEFPMKLCEVFCVETLNMYDILVDFEKYCREYNLDNIDILVRQDYMKQFSFHTYSSIEDSILYFNIPFNRFYEVGETNHTRNVNSLFGYGRIKEISCNISRINILKDKISTKEFTF